MFCERAREFDFLSISPCTLTRHTVEISVHCPCLRRGHPTVAGDGQFLTPEHDLEGVRSRNSRPALLDALV